MTLKTWMISGVTLGLLGLGGILAITNFSKVDARPQAPVGVAPSHSMFGGTPGRNFVIPNEKFAPVQLMPVKEEDKVLKEADAVIKWQADLGSRAYGGPTIAGGKVFVGTNNEKPRNPRDSGKNADGDVEPTDMGILMCFDQATGKFLWQAVHQKLSGGPVVDWPKEGICSSPAVEGDRVYYVSNRCTIVCADIHGAANGRQGKPLSFTNAATKKVTTYDSETDADILWEIDMLGDLGVFPHNMSASSPVIVGDILFVVTANGVDEGHINIPAPQAPSFLAINKNTGKVLWKKSDPGKNIMHGQWSNPTYAEIKGVKQVIFPGGDGWLYAYTPETGALVWKFDCNPKDSKYELGGTGTRNDFIGTPVVYDNKIFIGVGQDPEHFSGVGHFWCIDPTKANEKNLDISPRDTAFDPKDPKNADSGLVWHYGGADKRQFVPRDFLFGRTMSTATIIDDIIYITELQGYLHCLDAKTGKKFWQYDLKGAIWGSTILIDGKVYIATESGDLFVFKHSKEPISIDEIDNPGAKDNKDFNVMLKEKRKQVEKQYLLGKCEFDAPIRSTPIVVGGIMYVMTEKTLYALEAKK
ncbi:MAG: PQQ-binding-like beta-propeller repeat protein [Fimbriiglobus sp.]